MAQSTPMERISGSPCTLSFFFVYLYWVQPIHYLLLLAEIVFSAFPWKQHLGKQGVSSIYDSNTIHRCHYVLHVHAIDQSNPWCSHCLQCVNTPKVMHCSGIYNVTCCSSWMSGLNKVLWLHVRVTCRSQKAYNIYLTKGSYAKGNCLRTLSG